MIVSMADQTSSNIKKLIPLGAGVVLGLIVLAIFGPIQSLIGLILGYVVARVIMFPKPGSPTIRRIGPGTDTALATAAGVDAADLESTLREARQRQMQLANEAFRVTRPEVRQNIDGIASATQRIIDSVKAEPKQLRNAYQFFGYYLEAALKIVKRYADMASRPVQSDEERAAMSSVEAELGTIKAAFEKQLTLLNEANMIDLDVELSVLKKTIEMEGLGGQ